MEPDGRPILEYASVEARSKTNRMAWRVVITVGPGVGLLAGISDVGFVCVAPIVGFIFGFSMSRVANTQRIAFGLLGNLVAAATTFATIVVIALWTHEGFHSRGEGIAVLMISVMALTLPGIVGGAIGLGLRANALTNIRVDRTGRSATRSPFTGVIRVAENSDESKVHDTAQDEQIR